MRCGGDYAVIQPLQDFVSERTQAFVSKVGWKEGQCVTFTHLKNFCFKDLKLKTFKGLEVSQRAAEDASKGGRKRLLEVTSNSTTSYMPRANPTSKPT